MIPRAPKRNDQYLLQSGTQSIQERMNNECTNPRQPSNEEKDDTLLAMTLLCALNSLIYVNERFYNYKKHIMHFLTKEVTISSVLIGNRCKF